MSAGLACACCGATYTNTAPAAEACCPVCGFQELAECAVEAIPAERFAAWVIPPDAAMKRLEAFVLPTPLASRGLHPTPLAARLARVWWPYWLVDVDADGVWQAEAGFDYEVQSTVEHFSGGGWTVRPVTEVRQRWEPRSGTLRRRYDDVSIAARADESARSQCFGPPPATERSGAVGDVMVLLPDLPSADQWPEAVESVRRLAGADCQKASGADHFRELYLKLDASSAAWTLALAPMYTTWYIDDDGRRHVLWVDGVTGAVAGRRVSSQRRANRSVLILASLGLGSVGVSIVLALVGVILWPLLLAALVVALVGLVACLIAPFLWLRPKMWNRTEASGRVPGDR